MATFETEVTAADPVDPPSVDDPPGDLSYDELLYGDGRLSVKMISI